jgi:hypothetical protein
MSGGNSLQPHCIPVVFLPALMVSECRQGDQERGKSRFPRKWLFGQTFSKSVGLWWDETSAGDVTDLIKIF